MSLPAWMEPIVTGAAAITGEHLTRFLPPHDHSGRTGAVLMLFGEGDEGPDLLLTERSHTMRSHPGQISFPGGSIDPEDESPAAAALREAWEETDLDIAGVDLVWEIPQLWLPPSNFAVTPVLGYWRERSAVKVVDHGEVERVLQVPLEELLDPTNRVTVRHPIGYQSPGFMVGPGKELILWGFTAGIINKLFDFIGWTREWDPERVVELPDYMLRQE